MKEAKRDRLSILEGSSESFEAKEIFYSVLERRWLLIICLLLGVGAGFLYMLFRPETYQSHTALLIERQPTVIKIDQPKAEGDPEDAVVFKTIEQTMQSRVMFQRVVKAAKLSEIKGVLPAKADGALAMFGRVIDAIKRRDYKSAFSPIMSEGFSSEEDILMEIPTWVTVAGRPGTFL